jgi:hypothetical protein
MVSRSSASARAAGKGYQGEQDIRSTRFENQLGWSATDGGLGRGAALPQTGQRPAKLVHRDQDLRLAHAGGDVDAVHLDPQYVEDAAAFEPA